MKIEIDDEYADAILVGVLAESYIMLKDMAKNPKAWHEDDVEHWSRLMPAIELVGAYYCTDFKAAIKKAKKNELKS